MQALSEGVNAVLALDPAAPAMEFEKAWISWGVIAAAKTRIEAALAGAPDALRVAVFVRNRPEAVSPILACVTNGWCLVTMNPVNPDDRLAEDVEAVAAPVVIAATREWARPGVTEAARRVGSLCLEVRDDLTIGVLADAARPLADFPRATSPGVAVEMLTSGTTGRPKRVPFRAEAMEKAVLAALNFEAGRKAGDAPVLRPGVQLLTGPMSHIGGLLAFLNAILSGRRSCLLERFTVETFHDAVRRHRPKVAGAPPAGLKMLLDADLPREDFASLSALRTGTAPLDPDLADAIHAAYGVPVLQNYGATEFGGVAGWTLGDFKAHYPQKRGAVGRVNPGVEARVVDAETHQPLAPGEKGVLELRGRQVGDGETWVRTTDIAIVDADRFLFILGRSDNVIIRGGFKVDPDEVAGALRLHEAIHEAAVIGLPDARLGHVPAAAYVLKPGAADPGAAALAEFVRARLLPYKTPVRFLKLDELPRTTSMKVSQLELRERFAEETP